jgi:hypothetical protein
MSTLARFSVTMWLGLASTKCGSSVDLASDFTSTRSPPISRASAARSGVVATTLTFGAAMATVAANMGRSRRLFMIYDLRICGLRERP